MNNLPNNLEETLKEYTEIQQEEQELKARKQALQEKLKAHLRNDERKVLYPEIGGARLKVSYRSAVQVEYAEEELKSRLGERYRLILKPDPKKLRVELPNLENELEPLLDRIGSPSPDKVKAAVESGVVSAEEFKGAFTKTLREYVTVAMLRGSSSSFEA